LVIQGSYWITDTVGEAIWNIVACDRTSMKAESSFQLEGPARNRQGQGETKGMRKWDILSPDDNGEGAVAMCGTCDAFGMFSRIKDVLPFVGPGAARARFHGMKVIMKVIMEEIMGRPRSCPRIFQVFHIPGRSPIGLRAPAISAPPQKLR
jgi:hypothetical protein